MRNDMEALLAEAQEALTACDGCPERARCVFATAHYEPGRCLHEYKLLHAFLWSRRPGRGRLDAAVYGRLAEEARQYAGFLRRTRPFDAAHVSNPPPVGPDVPFQEGAAQSTLSAFAIPG